MRARLVLMIALTFQLSSCTPSYAQSSLPGIPGNLAVKAILGEAGGLSSYEQEAIAHALRNRASLKGVYGVGSNRPSTQKERLAALETWKKAMSGPDVTKGATNWLSRWDLKHCRPSLIAWRFKIVKTYETKHFVFYKEVK